jgi:hypothetical protein
MRNKSFIELVQVKKFILCIRDIDKIRIIQFINSDIDISSNTLSMKRRRIECLFDLYKIHTDLDSIFLLHREYYSIQSTKDKLRMRFGKSRADAYEITFSNRKRGKAVSRFTIDYWTNLGYSVEDAIIVISDIQKKNSSNRTKESYSNASLKMPISIDYWVNLGYTIEDAEVLREPYLLECKNDLSSYIHRYGETTGLEKYNIRCLNYKNTMEKILPNKRTGGYVSKESLLFFIQLYKFCRKLGILRNEIYFGIKGSREYFIRDNSLQQNGGYFYDFVIPKFNMVIEYHGIFLHPRYNVVWKNPFSDYNISKEKDLYKQTLAENRGFNYYIVWSDDNKLDKLTLLSDIIKVRYYEQIA